MKRQSQFTLMFAFFKFKQLISRNLYNINRKKNLGNEKFVLQKGVLSKKSFDKANVVYRMNGKIFLGGNREC